MIGAESTRTEYSQGDTAELTGVIYLGSGRAAEPSDVAAVNFTVKQPDGTTTTTSGSIQPDGTGFLRYTDTNKLGLYIWTAQFTLTTGEKKTHRDEFFVYDPMEVPPIDRREEVAAEVWRRIEDCFDSNEGGPWLRDKTLAYFDPTKVAKFIPDGLMMINSWPPATQLTLADFTTPIPETDPLILQTNPTATQPDPDRILVVQATLIAVIRHLMRSYVEQPNLQNANVAWQDRRDYLQRWGTILQLEEQWFHDYLLMWKRQFYNFGKSALLIGTKAGRQTNIPGYRARNAARGFYPY